MKHRCAGIVAVVILALLFAGCQKRPPTVTCSVAPQQITQGEKATVKTDVVTPKKNQKVTYSYTATGGKVTGTEGTATFDSTGVNPGKYTVTVTVADKYKNNVPCTTDITVEKKYLPPTVACSAAPSSIQEPESATITAKAASPDGSPLTYSWTVNGQAQPGSSPEFVLGSVGRQPGNYNVAVTVNTGKFTATCSSAVTVRELPVPPPTISCLTPTASIESGSTVQLNVQATAERATPTISWSATGGTISGSGNSAVFNAAGLSAGSYTATATVDNGQGGKASCSTAINVSQRINVSGFAVGGKRVNNEAKAVLDNVAVQMKNDPRLRASIAGFIDKGEAKSVGLKRAKAVAEYLVSKGIDASRIATTDGGVSAIGNRKTAAGRAENRRAEVFLSVQ
jgi:outer membrane protein OmpA-like peptidoglycan-associated protein